MLFNDVSCIPENTIESQLNNSIPQLLGSDWFGIVILFKNLNFKIDAKYDLNQIGDDFAVDFLSNNKAELYHQDYKYKLFDYNMNHYVIFPIRSTEISVIFFVHCRTKESGPFNIRDLEWNTVYAKAAYKTILVNNELIQEHDYIENVIESTESAIVVFDLKHKIVSYNNVAKTTFNMEKPGISIYDINIKDEDMEKLLASYDRVISTGKKEKIQKIFVFREGRGCLLNIILSPLRNSKKIICGCILVGNDITKEQIFEYQFEQLKHYAWLGEIAFSLSHDVKNPLTNIKGCSAFLKKNKGIQKSELDFLNLITHEVDRIDDIINQMMSFGKVSKQNDYILLNINEIIYNCIQIVNRQKVYKSIDISYELDKDTPLLKAKNIDIQQIFLNILINSLQSIENEGIIDIRSYYSKDEEKLTINISDNGIGVESSVMDKLFEPYMTTKKDGTGLGLYIVRKVLDKYNGAIRINSPEHKGTLCEIILPITNYTK